MPLLGGGAASVTRARLARVALGSPTRRRCARAARPAPSTGSTRRPGPRAPWLAVAADRLCPRYAQAGVRQQRQREVPIPAGPLAARILVPPHLALGRCQPRRHRSACARHLHPPLEGRRPRRTPTSAALSVGARICPHAHSSTLGPVAPCPARTRVQPSDVPCCTPARIERCCGVPWSQTHSACVLVTPKRPSEKGR